MKKIIISSVALSLLAAAALPVMADVSSTTASSTETVKRPVDVACMVNAVGKRDDAIGVAFDAYAAAIKSAIVARKSALQAAWGLSTRKDHNQAQMAAWKAWRDAVRAAARDLRKARLDAWKQFRSDRKSCNGHSEDKSNEGSDGL